MFVIIWMISIQLLKAAQDPDWLEEGMLEGFVAQEIAEEGHLLDILVLVTLSNFHSAVLSVRSTAALWQAWGGSAWRRCHKRSRWGSWRRRWTRAPGGWSWWSTGSRLGVDLPGRHSRHRLHCMESFFTFLRLQSLLIQFFFIFLSQELHSCKFNKNFVKNTNIFLNSPAICFFPKSKSPPEFVCNPFKS